jgi:hypothetical protein
LTAFRAQSGPLRDGIDQIEAGLEKVRQPNKAVVGSIIDPAPVSRSHPSEIIAEFLR